MVVERDICGGAISINFHCSSTVFDCFRLFLDCFRLNLGLFLTQGANAAKKALGSLFEKHRESGRQGTHIPGLQSGSAPTRGLPQGSASMKKMALAASPQVNCVYI